jgi:hypothetical protein
MYGLLEDMRLVEIASFIAAPTGTLYLRELGADVVRIDPIGGGPDRGRWPLAPGGDSLYWEGLNKGKQSIQIDLARAEPVAIEKYGRSVVIVMAVEEYERLSGKAEKRRSGTKPASGKGAKA